MRPPQRACSAALPASPPTSASSAEEDSGGGSSSTSFEPREMLRGGSAQAITIPQLNEEEDYGYSEEDGYYFLDDEGDAAEYEYYEDDGDGDGYYYEDSDTGDDGEEYLYLPDADEAGDASHRKRKAPSVRKSLGPIASKALSVTGALPAALPGIASNISSLPRAISTGVGKLPGALSGSLSNIPSGLAGFDAPTASAAVALSILLVSAMARVIVTGSLLPRGGRRTRRKKRSGSRWSRLLRPGGKGDTSNAVDDEGEASYGEYSDAAQEDGDMVDLDLEGEETTDKSGRARIPKTGSWRNAVPAAAGVAAGWIGGRMRALAVPFPLRLGAGRKKAVDATDFEETQEEEVFPSEPADEDALNSSSPEEASAEVESLRQRVDELTVSNDALEQEYEASLRMLHEARLQVRKLQSAHPDEGDAAEGEDRPDPKPQLEAAIQKLEAKYKAQMKERMEQIREQMEGKFRMEVEEEVTERITAKLEKETEEKEDKLEEEMEKRLADAKQQAKEEMDQIFEETVEEAVDRAVAAERASAKEELAQIKAAVREVLERERRLMREQVRRATGRAREWVENRQREELMRRAAALQEEAERYGGGARRAAPRGGRRRDGVEPREGRRRPEGYEDDAEMGA